MSTTPLSSTILGHFFTKNEKFNFIKTFGILIGFSGIVYLFSDDFLINDSNFVSALLILLGSTCYVIGGVLTLKISQKKNESGLGVELEHFSINLDEYHNLWCWKSWVYYS